MSIGKLKKKGLIRGDSIDSVLAASIYVSVRQSGVLRTIDEISKSIDVKPKLTARSYRRIVTQLGIKVPTIDLTRYIGKIANQLEFSETAKRKALELVERARKKEEDTLAGKDPLGLAASVLYIVNSAEKHPMTQSEIARTAGVTEVTLRNRSKELRKKLDLNY